MVVAFSSRCLVSLWLFALFASAAKKAKSASGQSKAANKQPLSSEKDFVFLTFANGSDAALEVNLVTAPKKNSVHLVSEFANGTAKQTSTFARQFVMLKASSPDKPVSRTAAASLTLYSARARNLSSDGAVEYQVQGVTNGAIRSLALPVSDGQDYQLRVCVFGDFSENLYEQTALDLSKLVEQQKCNLNLFIGKIAWERRLRPHSAFSFSPYVMLHSQTSPHKHSAFARVPSIFGAVGSSANETTYFHASVLYMSRLNLEFFRTEVGDVAFIQITVEIATVADLPDGTEAYNMISQYFRETMLNELECKLQELHRRPKRPWIVLYMTHPYLVSNDEDSVQWFIMNDTDRFFEVLKRYKVDLLTSCGIEGMSRILAKKRTEEPDAKLPEYIQTTMAQCGGYQSMDVTLQNECSYAVLDIQPGKLSFQKRNADNGTRLDSGQVQRTFAKPDLCVPDEL